MRFNRVLMEEATDAATSNGMGAGEAINTSEMTEEQALSMLSDDYTEPTTPTDENINNGETPTTTDDNSNDPLNDIEIDMSMFGDIEQEENPEAQQEQTQEQEPAPQNSQSEMMQQILNKLDGKEENSNISEEETAALSQLAQKLQEAGLLPKGISEEDSELLKEVKSLRDEINQAKELQQQQQEFEGKINDIDNYSKELEGLIPGYNSEFMISLVGKIANQNPKAGEKILNNPTMLTQLWKQYGAKAQPVQEQTNLINSNNRGGNGQSDLFQKVQSGKASIDEEARLLASL